MNHIITLQQRAIFSPAALLNASPGANDFLAFVSATGAGWRAAAQGILGRLGA